MCYNVHFEGLGLGAYPCEENLEMICISFGEWHRGQRWLRCSCATPRTPPHLKLLLHPWCTFKQDRISLIFCTCWNVDIGDLYVVVDADGVTAVAQNGPQLIYYCNIWDVQLNGKDVIMNNWRSCREEEKLKRKCIIMSRDQWQRNQMIHRSTKFLLMCFLFIWTLAASFQLYLLMVNTLKCLDRNKEKNNKNQNHSDNV